MRDVDAERGQVRRSNTGRIACSCRGALDFSRGKKRLKKTCRIENITRANAWRGHSRRVDRDKRLRYLPVAVDDAQRLYDIGNLAVDGRVEDAVAGANHGLVVFERVPRK